MNSLSTPEYEKIKDKLYLLPRLEEQAPFKIVIAEVDNGYLVTSPVFLDNDFDRDVKFVHKDRIKQ